MNHDLISRINSPEDLKALNKDEIPILCSEIRDFLINNVERSGGHLASNLGVTELTVALHRVFDSPRDHIIFDVGHQSYVHKILTGRRERFQDLRRPGGLSGFTSMKESVHDPFGAGHSSTAVSAALGYAEAERLSGSDAYTVAVVGDGAYTGGMIHEALNNCDPELRLIIILNENGMSISVNKGRFASYLSRVRMSKGYMRWKDNTKSVLNRVPLGRRIARFLGYVKTKIKNTVFSSNYFEDLGLYYIGVVDGNNYNKIESALNEAKRLAKCVVVHVKTVKGKGYQPAEESPDNFHSIGSATEKERTFHSVFADELSSLAENNQNIVAVTAAMGMGTGLDVFGEKYPDRYFDVGIAEEHALTFSAGLSAAGLLPYAAIYSTFLQRGYDNIAHDIALQSLPVRMIVDRAGLSVSDGATHHGIFDVAFLSHIPGIRIFAPSTYASLKRAIAISKTVSVPMAIRYPNSDEAAGVDGRFSEISPLGVRIDFDTSSLPEYIFITYGTIVSRVISASDMLKKRGISVGIILLEELKPYGKLAEHVLPYLSSSKRILFVEEGIKNGGAAMLLSEALSELGFQTNGKYRIAAIDDSFAVPDKICDIYEYLGFSPESLAKRLTEE